MNRHIYIYTLSPISETNISEKAAVKPDFATAARTEDGPPLRNVIRENTKPQLSSTSATDKE